MASKITYTNPVSGFSTTDRTAAQAEGLRVEKEAQADAAASAEFNRIKQEIIASNPNLADFVRRVESNVAAGSITIPDAVQVLNEGASYESAQKRFKTEREAARERFQTTSLEQQGRSFQLAQPIIQQELNRLGILQSGAAAAVPLRTLGELEVGRQGQLAAFEQGTMQEASQIPLSGLGSILGLQRQRRAQALAMRMQQQQLQAMLQAARYGAEGQEEAAKYGFYGDVASAGIKAAPYLWG